MTRIEVPLVGAGGEPVDFRATIGSHGLGRLAFTAVGIGETLHSPTAFEDVARTLCTISLHVA